MEKKIKIARIIQLVTAIITFLMLFSLNSINEDEIGIPNSLIFIPFIMYIGIIAGIVIEYIYKQQPIVRTIVLSLALFSAAIFLTDGIDLSASTLIIFAIPYTIIMIFVLSKGQIVTTYAKIKNNKTLPEGIFAKKDLIIQYIFWIIFAIILVILCIIFEMKNISYLYLFLLVPFAIIILLVITFKTSTLRKLLNIINKDLNYDKFILELEKIQMNNLHPQTYNYLEIIKVNYMFVYDIDSALILFQNIQRPTNKQYLLFYNVVEIEYLIRTKNYDSALKSIEKINDNQKPMLQNFYKLFVTEEEMLNIENIYKENNKLKFNNASSIYAKMYYYYTRGNQDKAKIYARKIIGLAPGFKEYIVLANKILKD